MARGRCSPSSRVGKEGSCHHLGRGCRRANQRVAMCVDDLAHREQTAQRSQVLLLGLVVHGTIHVAVNINNNIGAPLLVIRQEVGVMWSWP